ncbi:type 1 glutamine amidotransferase domain-containing protein [Shewanella woodyi]|uniref:type 1 glutamine amidotransferase domain-containing protein n=1 Tax=Shewanella woodyi TaxID=60961 RepID=UPI0037484B4D
MKNLFKTISVLLFVASSLFGASSVYAEGPKRVLIVMSSESAMGISGKLTGTWFEEVATPYYTLRKEGYEVVMASLEGGDAPIDLLSMQAPFTTPNTDKFLNDIVAMHALENTNKLSEINPDDFDALFFPGGYGLLWDLASDSMTIKMIEDFYAANKPIAMVCHAPAILRDVKKANGEPLVKGLTVTGFMNAEDDELDLSRHLLFSLEDMLKANGGNYKKTKKNWVAHIEIDGPLMTGQNPASAPVLAKALAKRLK